MRLPTYALLLCKEVPSAPYIYFLRVDESIFSCLPVALRGGREMSTVPEKQASSSASNKSFFIQNFSFFPHGLGDMQEQWQWFKALVIQGREWTTAFKDGLGGRIDMRKKGPIKNRAFLQDYWGQIGIENRGSAFFTKTVGRYLNRYTSLEIFNP